MNHFLRKEEYTPPPQQDAKERGWLGIALIRLISLAIVGAAVYYSTEGLVVMFVLFILVVPVEKIFPRHRGQKVRRPLYKLDISWSNVITLLNLIGLIAAVIIAIISICFDSRSNDEACSCNKSPEWLPCWIFTV